MKKTTDLKSFFVQRNIPFDPLDEGGIRSIFSTTLSDGREHTFSFFVLRLRDDFGDEFVRFTIVPYIEHPSDSYPETFYKKVSQVNHQLPILRFSFDADGDLELTLDIRLDLLNDTQFDQILQMLADYAGSYYPELEAFIEQAM